MENRVGVVDERCFDGIPDEKRADKGVVASSDEVKDLAEGEVFEEAIDAPAHLPEDGEKVGLVDEMAGDSCLAVVDVSFNVEHDEDERFEEPSGVLVEYENFGDAASDEIEKHEVEGAMMDAEEKAGYLVGGVSADEAVYTNRIDEGGTGDETAVLGSSGCREDRLVGEGESKEEPDVDTDGVDKILGASNYEDKMSGRVIEHSESQDPDESAEPKDVSRSLISGYLDDKAEALSDIEADLATGHRASRREERESGGFFS